MVVEIKRRFHLLEWSKVCKLKKEGGLGFRPLKLMNGALLGKWLWKLGDEFDGLWKKILNAKYRIHRNGQDPKMPRSCLSHLWRGIMSVKDDFHSFIHFRVGSGQFIWF